MAADFASGSSACIGHPHALFELDMRDPLPACFLVRSFDVAPDGKRFCGVQRRTPPPSPVVTHIGLIIDWLQELKAAESVTYVSGIDPCEVAPQGRTRTRNPPVNRRNKRR